MTKITKNSANRLKSLNRMSRSRLHAWLPQWKKKRKSSHKLLLMKKLETFVLLHTQVSRLRTIYRHKKWIILFHEVQISRSKRYHRKVMKQCKRKKLWWRIMLSITPSATSKSANLWSDAEQMLKNQCKVCKTRTISLLSCTIMLSSREHHSKLPADSNRLT